LSLIYFLYSGLEELQKHQKHPITIDGSTSQKTINENRAFLAVSESIHVGMRSQRRCDNVTDGSLPWLADRDYRRVGDMEKTEYRITSPWIPVIINHNEPRGPNEVEAHTPGLCTQKKQD
jgi:hypothetical protein